MEEAAGVTFVVWSALIRSLSKLALDASIPGLLRVLLSSGLSLRVPVGFGKIFVNHDQLYTLLVILAIRLNEFAPVIAIVLGAELIIGAGVGTGLGKAAATFGISGWFACA
jgi:hypothetical protein